MGFFWRVYQGLSGPPATCFFMGASGGFGGLVHGVSGALGVYEFMGFMSLWGFGGFVWVYEFMRFMMSMGL